MDKHRKTEAQTEVLRFNSRDIAEYGWIFTRHFYGHGHYLGEATFGSNLTGLTTTVSILHHDIGALNLPVFRHHWRIYELFVPGLTRGDGRHVDSSKFYPLTPEERKEAEKIIHEEFEEQLEKEIACLIEYAKNNFLTQSGPRNFNPRKLNILFGHELYKGEDQESFRARKVPFRPSVSIYVWKDGFRPSRPKKINS